MCNLPEVREPFHQLCCVVFVELDVREVHLEHRRAGVAHPEEHQLSLAQVHRRQCRRVQRSQGFTMVAIWYIYICFMISAFQFLQPVLFLLPTSRAGAEQGGEAIDGRGEGAKEGGTSIVAHSSAAGNKCH